jgi:DNA gyrase subunit A
MGEIIKTNITEEVQEAYLEYAMSVIVGRALPDIRDGLKPVHRRVLYAMHNLNNRYNQSYKKSARVVGDVIGKYHPHGDVAVYDTLVRMAQDFSLRYPLIQGQGNFGSIDGDRAAAMRYTEIRMAKVTDLVLQDLDKETVDWGPNYDGSLDEPLVLPSVIPNLLINGAGGIAVGMSTNIPPHNLTEVTSAILHLIEHPETAPLELMKFIPGPDFPTGAIIHGNQAIKQAYTTGKGVIQLRAKVEIEELKGGRTALIVEEIPYQVTKSTMIQKMADLVRDKVIEGISDIRDESNRKGMRIVILLRKGDDPNLVLNQLYKHTQLQTSFGIQLLALDNKQPRLFNLKDMLLSFVTFRREIIRKRSEYDLRKLQEKIHVLEGLIIALNNIDKVVALIKKSASSAEAQTGLVHQFELTEIQAKAILDMRLHRLTQLETKSLKLDCEDCKKQAEKIKKLLSSEKLILQEIKNELMDIQKAFGDKRRTQIIKRTQEFSEEDFISDEEMVITISHKGYVKKGPLDNYRAQKRGGRGIRGAGIKDEDFIQDVFITSNHNVLLCFSDRGRLYWLKVHRIPEQARGSRGRPIVNLLNIQSHEKIVSVVPVTDFEQEHFIVMVTHKGIIKKCSLQDFKNMRSGGIIAMKCDVEDSLIEAKITTGTQNVLLVTQNGKSIRFEEKQVRKMGRNARGVAGMRLESSDAVVSMAIPEKDTSMLCVSNKGYGKRTVQSEFRSQKRGGSGVMCMKTTDKVGKVMGAIQVAIEDEVMMVTNQGQMIRIKIKDVSQIGRVTQGVRLFRLQEGEFVVSMALCAESDSEEEK